MDHIPKPSDALPCRVSIPYLPPGELAYDGQVFAEFPERIGISIKELLRGNLRHYNWMENLTFIQQWLWFGVISQVLTLMHIGFTLKDFIRKRSDGQSIITPKMLPYYIGIWETKINLSLPQDRARMEEEVCAILRYSRKVVGDLVPKNQFESNTPYLQQERQASSRNRICLIQTSLWTAWIGACVGRLEKKRILLGS